MSVNYVDKGIVSGDFDFINVYVPWFDGKIEVDTTGDIIWSGKFRAFSVKTLERKDIGILLNHVVNCPFNQASLRYVLGVDFKYWGVHSYMKVVDKDTLSFMLELGWCYDPNEAMLFFFDRERMVDSYSKWFGMEGLVSFIESLTSMMKSLEKYAITYGDELVLNLLKACNIEPRLIFNV